MPWRDTRTGLVEPPSLPAAVGLIALYFLLQAVASGLIALFMGLLTGFVHIERGAQPVGAEIRAMLGQPGMPAILVMLTLGLAAAVIVPLVIRKWPALWSKSRLPGLGMVLPVNPAFFVLAIAVGVAAPLLGGVLTAVLAHGKTVTQDIQSLGAHTPLGLRLALVAVVVSLGPMVEEILFRGVLLSALTRRWRIGWSTAISAVVFALAHLPSMQWQWYALPDLALLAGALTWLRLRAGSLWPAIVAHGVNNLLAVVAWFVAAGSA
jgi:membrane protease YdiL (CAAX protease family)